MSAVIGLHSNHNSALIGRLSEQPPFSEGNFVPHLGGSWGDAPKNVANVCAFASLQYLGDKLSMHPYKGSCERSINLAWRWAFRQAISSLLYQVYRAVSIRDAFCATPREHPGS